MSLSFILSGLIGIFPSNSHTSEAAIKPIIAETNIFFEFKNHRVEYANIASPAPTGSITFFAKLSRAKKDLN